VVYSVRKITVDTKNKCYTDIINLFIIEWEAFMMLFLTAGVVIITTLIGTLISAELSESAH